MAQPNNCPLGLDSVQETVQTSTPMQDYNTLWGMGGQDILLISNLGSEQPSLHQRVTSMNSLHTHLIHKE